MTLWTWAGIAALIITTVFMGGSTFVSQYHMEKNYRQAWELADKSSTIPAKRKHVDKFVASLEEGYARGDFASHNAIFFKTNNNSFTHNLEALRTLSERLNEVQDMDPSSFEYNTAIQQITEQEQGEADNIIAVFTGCFILKNYVWVWSWVSVIPFLCIVAGGLTLVVVTFTRLGF